MLVPQLQAQEPLVPVAPVKVTQRIIYNSDEPIDAAARQRALAMRNVAHLLNVVTDRATADAAAAEVARNMAVLHGHGEPLPDEVVTGQQAIDYHTAAVEAEKRQRAAFYRGSVALAKALRVPEAWATLPSEAQMAAARENLTAIRAVVVLLSNVVDKRSAAAAAPEVLRLREQMQAYETQLAGLDMINMLLAAGMEEEEMQYIPMCLARLRDVNVYGCEELASALDLTIEIVDVPDDLTDAELGALCSTLMQRYAAAAEVLEGVSGGPGIKPDDAWILACTDEVRALFMEKVLTDAKVEYIEYSEAGAKMHLSLPWNGRNIKLQLWTR